jgi:acyl CoA:acetate/3-ketoacid CoA transferase beta subunit
MTADTLSRFELFLLTAAREYDESLLTFVGFHWPMVAARIARRLGADNLVVVYECGVVEDSMTPELSTSPSDLRAAVGSPYAGTSMDALFGWLGRGRVAKTMLEAPIVDSRGNVNTTIVGDYDSPRVRLPGSGGGTELASLGKGLTLLCASEDPRSFPDRVDYITSPGFLAAPGERAGYGYPADTGPGVLITPLGRFGLHDDRPAEVLGLHQGVAIDEVRACMPWVRTEVDSSVALLPAPSDEEVDAVRAVLAESRLTHYALPNRVGAR